MRSIGSSPVFYLPERPHYTILASAIDSARYAVAATTSLKVGANALSFLTDVHARPVRSGGRLIQGIGYCATAPYGACQLYRLGKFIGHTEFVNTALRLAEHSIYAGYFDHPEIPVRLYRDAESDDFFDQLEARNEYFDVGHMAKAVNDVINLADIVDGDARNRIAELAARFGNWLLGTPRTSGGWLPRRLTHDLKLHTRARLPSAISVDAAGGLKTLDPIAERSGAGLLSIACMLRLDQVGFTKSRAFIAETCDAFIDGGGYFGSINTDTADLQECVSFALGFQVLLDVSSYLATRRYREFAYDVCLPGLEQFWLYEDINGQPTKGLLRLSETYSSACFWECAEAALAYLKAGLDLGSAIHVLNGLTILRAVARNHYGPVGFVPSELDWEGRIYEGAHVESGRFGARAFTHPYMNNLQILSPTLFYLEKLAWRIADHGDICRRYLDAQGNQLWPM